MTRIQVYNKNNFLLWTVRASSAQQGYEIMSDTIENMKVEDLCKFIVLLVDETTGEVLWEYNLTEYAH